MCPQGRTALERAALRPLRFHDLRHTFGTRVIGVADIRRVQEWMCHANVHMPDFEDSGQDRLL